MQHADAPPTSAGDDYLRRARRLVGEGIRRRWQSGLLNRDPDGVFTALLGAEHVEKLLAEDLDAVTSPPLGAFEYPQSSALGRFIKIFALSPSQADLCAILLAAETDSVTLRLLTYLSGNQSQGLTVELVLDIIYLAHTAQRLEAIELLHDDLAPHHPLRRLQIVLMEAGSGSKTLLAQSIRVHPWLLRWLVKDGGMSVELMGEATLIEPHKPIGECAADALRSVVAAFSAGSRLLLIEGPAQSGRRMLLEFAAARLNRRLLICNGLRPNPELIVSLFREAVLQRALLSFENADAVLEGEGLVRFRECLEAYPDTVALIGSEALAMRLGAMRPLTVVQVATPASSERLRMWRTYLGPSSALSEPELQNISALYNIGISGIVRSSNAAREQSAFSGRPLDRVTVAQAVRRLFDADITLVGKRVEVTQEWEDLVIPDDVGESIYSLVDRVRYRSEVMGTWGFAQKLGKGLGLTALFSGEPGTGKSMVAGLIAKELGLDLYVIDLSRLVSKWLGETEKNLARALDAAEAGHVLLLFDEADTVLARRSPDIRTSNDRHANMETNFILARLEQFQGTAIFTTNLASAIDPAVMRRMSAHIHFPFPDIMTRAELWRRLIPNRTPIADDLDFELLAEKYEITGGVVRNVVLRAAFYAARQRGPLCMRHMLSAAEAEYRERGSILRSGRLV